jgi:hypothetical protein
MVPWVVPGSPTTSCHSFTSRGSARPKELFPTVSHPVSRRLPAYPCANCMPKITREKDADRTLPSCSRTRRLWHIGAMPQSSTLQLYAKLRNVAVVRFSLRNSIQQGLWTCQNFDLWMQELTTRLEVSGMLCARLGRRGVSSRTSSGRTEMRTDTEPSRQISIIPEQNMFLTKADVCRSVPIEESRGRQTEKFTSVPDMRAKPRYVPRRPRHTAESKPALCGDR